ncbi:hypothetical protein J3R82DRAFT_8592, partial [Butyriboletus roseoflavus]
DDCQMLRHYKFYETILTQAPALIEELNARMEAKELTNICDWISTLCICAYMQLFLIQNDQITTGMSEQHSTDLRSFKIYWTNISLSELESLNPPVSNGLNKSDHEFNHPQIAHLLCPHKKLDVFNEDPDLMIATLQDGTVNSLVGNWPTCFYEDGIYDTQNKLKGLFCSEMIFRFYKHLFIGPSAAKMNAIVSNTSKPFKNQA